MITKRRTQWRPPFSLGMYSVWISIYHCLTGVYRAGTGAGQKIDFDVYLQLLVPRAITSEGA